MFQVSVLDEVYAPNVVWHHPTNPLTGLRATPPSHLRRMVG